jgi:hypothetical protein
VVGWVAGWLVTPSMAWAGLSALVALAWAILNGLPAFAVALVVLAVLTLALLIGHLALSLRDRLRKSSTGLRFGPVEVGKPRPVHESNVFVEDWNGVPIVFNLVNPHGGHRARDIRPTVVVRGSGGEVLAGPANGRWANPVPPKTEEVERDIPANGAPVAIDTVIQEMFGDKFWLVTDENLRRGLKANSQAITAPHFEVTVTVQGENVLPLSKTVGITLGFPLPIIQDSDAIQDPSKTLEFPGSGESKDPLTTADDLPSALDSLIREGMALYAELSAPVQHEVRGSTVEVAGGEAPEDWHEKASVFRQKVHSLLKAQSPALLPLFRDGANTHLHKQREEVQDQAPARDNRSNLEKARDMATWQRGGPATEVEMCLEGLAAVRNHLGYQS